MKIKSKRTDKLYIFIFAIVLLCVFLIMMYIQRYTGFWGDDFFFSRYSHNSELFESLNFEKGGHGGGYIGLFLCKFFSYCLPLFLNIHPADFVGNWHSAIKSVFFICLLLLMSKFSTFYNKSKWLYISTVLFLAFYVLYLTAFSNITWISYNFYRYLCSLIPLSFLLYYIYKNSLVNYKKVRLLELITVCFCAYFVGSSLELIFFGILFFVTLLVVYNIVVKLLSKIKNLNIDFEKLKLNLNYKFYIPICVMSTAVLLFTQSSGYKTVSSSRGMGNINISLDLVSEFTHLYKVKCFQDIWLYWIVFFLLLIVSAIFMYRRNEIKKIVYPVLLLTSILTVMYSLVMCGKSFTDCGFPQYYLNHDNIIAIYKLLILYPFFILLGYVYKLAKRKNFIKILIVSILLIFPFYFFCISDEQIKHKLEFFYSIKKEQYVIEKIMRFYYLNNETPIIEPKEFLAIIKQCMEIWEEYPSSNKLLSHMDLIYKNNDATRLGVIIGTDSIEKYYKKGGVFTEEELKELKFENLKDNNFVLNKKE